MRKIKFRAWVETREGNEMVYDWCFLNTQDNHFNAVDLTNERPDIGEVYSVMQFTGLLDKNGREIYEDMTLRIKGVMGDNKEYKYDAIYKVNKITHAGVSISFVKLYSEEPDSVDNSIPIHLNLSFADGLCLDYRNANYSNLCLEDTHGGNIVSRRKWQGNHYTNDIEVIGDIFNNPELIA